MVLMMSVYQQVAPDKEKLIICLLVLLDGFTHQKNIEINKIGHVEFVNW